MIGRTHRHGVHYPALAAVASVGVRLLDRVAGVHQRRGRAARIRPDEVVHQDEIRAGARERVAPPRARRHSRRRAARTVRPTIRSRSAIASTDGRCPGIRLAEQHVIRAELARDHGVVPRRKSADAGDAVGLQRWQRLLQRLDAGQMRAVGAGARDQFGVAVEQKRRARVLDRGRQRLDARDHGALIGRPQAAPARRRRRRRPAAPGRPVDQR